jgi:hypothetical protein
VTRTPTHTPTPTPTVTPTYGGLMGYAPGGYMIFP